MNKEDKKEVILGFITIAVWLLTITGTIAFWFLVFKALIKYVF